VDLIGKLRDKERAVRVSSPNHILDVDPSRMNAQERQEAARKLREAADRLVEEPNIDQDLDKPKLLS